MNIQPASENNIVHGQAQVVGAIATNSGKPAWILPGGRYTLNEGRARAIAREINSVLTRRAATA